MPRYNVTMPATLVFEIDAPTELAARWAIWSSFRAELAYDQLQGTSFELATDVARESGASNPQLMTTSTPLNDAERLETTEL